MQYGWSMEVFGSAVGEAAGQCGLAVADTLNLRFGQGVLGAINAELVYVPIIMPVDMHGKYRERSRLRMKAHLFECCPHLTYDAFVSGDLRDYMREFVRGLTTSIPHLARLGLSLDQLNAVSLAFEQAERDAVEALTASLPA